LLKVGPHPFGVANKWDLNLVQLFFGGGCLVATLMLF